MADSFRKMSGTAGIVARLRKNVFLETFLFFRKDAEYD